MAMAKDINGAMNELRRFTNDPLKNAPIAPMAQVHLATLYRSQNRPQDAVTLLAQTRQSYETALQNDPKRAALGAADAIPSRRRAARSGQDGGSASAVRADRQAIGRIVPKRWTPALRPGQCLKEDGQTKIDRGPKTARQCGSQSRTSKPRRRNSSTTATRISATPRSFLLAQATQLKEKQPTRRPARACSTRRPGRIVVLADQEVEAVRNKMIEEQWQKLKDEVAKNTPTGQAAAVRAEAGRAADSGAVAAGGKRCPTQYRALIEEFPDLAVNADARFELAELLAERGEHDEAIKLLKQALDKEPPPELTEKVRARLGDCLLAKGDTKAALGQFNRGDAESQECRCSRRRTIAPANAICRPATMAEACEALRRLPRSRAVSRTCPA